MSCLVEEVQEVLVLDHHPPPHQIGDTWTLIPRCWVYCRMMQDDRWLLSLAHHGSDVYVSCVCSRRLQQWLRRKRERGERRRLRPPKEGRRIGVKRSTRGERKRRRGHPRLTGYVYDVVVDVVGIDLLAYRNCWDLLLLLLLLLARDGGFVRVSRIMVEANSTIQWRESELLFSLFCYFVLFFFFFSFLSFFVLFFLPHITYPFNICVRVFVYPVCVSNVRSFVTLPQVAPDRVRTKRIA